MVYVLYIILTANTPPTTHAASIYTSEAACLKQADTERRKRSRVITYCVRMDHAEAGSEASPRSE